MIGLSENAVSRVIRRFVLFWQMAGENRKRKLCIDLTEMVKKRIPITKWLPDYNSEKLICDMIAGITVGLTVMPQGLAYATLAGLEPQV